MRVKMSKQPPPAPTASAVGPCPTVIQIAGRPGTGSLPSTIAPPDHPHQILRLFSLPVQKYKKLLLSLWCGHWHRILKFYNKFLLCDRQGTVKQAVLYVDRSC